MVIAVNTQIKFRAFGVTFGTYKDSKQFSFDPSVTSSWTIASDAKVVLTLDITPIGEMSDLVQDKTKHISVKVTGSFKSGFFKWTPVNETYIVPLPTAGEDGSYEVLDFRGIKLSFKLWKEKFAKPLK
jgi:hypothetical protein